MRTGARYDLTFSAELKQNGVRQQARQSTAGMVTPQTNPLLRGGRAGGVGCFIAGRCYTTGLWIQLARLAARPNNSQQTLDNFVRRAVPARLEH